MTDGGDETHARLLAAARTLYLDEGVANFSLREVARRTRLSPAAVYRHFANKEALLSEVCHAGFRTFGAYLMSALSAKTPRERLAASADAYRRFALENPQDYRVMFMGGLPGSKDDSPHETFQFLVDRVRECQRAGVLRKGDAVELAANVWAHVHGLVSLRITGHMTQAGSDAEFHRFYDRATDQLVRGLGPERKTRWL